MKLDKRKGGRERDGRREREEERRKGEREGRMGREEGGRILGKLSRTLLLTLQKPRAASGCLCVSHWQFPKGDQGEFQSETI